MALPPDIDFALDRRADPTRMNRAMTHLDARLRALETPKVSYDALLLQLQQIGLERINDALQPYYRALQAIVSLGVLFNAGSATAVPIAIGHATFTIAEGDRDRWAYAGFMVAVSQADTRNALLGRTVSYERSSGVYVLDVVIASGDADLHPADWIIMPAVPPFVPAAVIDAGSDAQNALSAVPYIPVGGSASSGIDLSTVTEFDPGTA